MGRWATVAGAAGLSLGLALPTGAQQLGSITGQVIDRSTRQPLVGVQVYIEGTSFGALTTENGRYIIPNVQPGTYTVTAQYIGYANGRVENIRCRPVIRRWRTSICPRWR